ncbi:cyclin Ccl1p [[Candida] jaroonii]|uniref:Cyclin Ccl1p n=1 Tax=[Candida] jaroonii TaxID=467808 RepID=A0ACA9YE87_9ASCO|nr:cyclin Ccl1p [[Candida] jaroonii]
MTNDPVARSNITADDLYRRSTQFRVWSYTKDKLVETRENTNENGRALAIKKFNISFETFKKDNSEIFESHKEELDPHTLIDLITLDEEIKYLNFYAKNILEAAKYFKMSTQVKSTALSFFKKFYLLNSVMQYHPKNILYTCLFLAAKSENYFISIETFCKGLQKTEPKDILDLEFTVLQSLKFTLLVHHPFRPLYGFFLDFQQVLSDIKIDEIGELYDQAKNWLNNYALLSDVSFLFTPPQIALAAMYDTNPNITNSYLSKKFKKLDTIKEGEVNGQTDYDLIFRTIENCIETAKQLIESTREESTKIDRKCFFAINPDKLINKKLKKIKQGLQPQ